MKIGIYTPYLKTLTGGEKYILSIASCLAKNNSVDIFWDDTEILSKASDKFDMFLEGVNIKPNIFAPQISLLKRLRETFSYDRIIVLSDGSIPIVASKELILHFQFPVEWVNGSAPFTRFKMSRVSKVICNSYFTKKYIDRKFNIKSFVLYPPSDINTGSIPEKENIILTVGRFSMLPNGTDFKKLSVLVDAFKDFQKKRLKGWELAIVTSVLPENEKEYEGFAKSIKSQYIKIHKNIPFREISKLYGKAKIYWHATGFGEDMELYPDRAEHFGISTVEAMSYGAVPIVINAGGQKEIVENGKNGFLWNTKEELVRLTHKVATDNELMSELSLEATRSSKQFSKDRFCEDLEHVI